MAEGERVCWLVNEWANRVLEGGVGVRAMGCCELRWSLREKRRERRGGREGRSGAGWTGVETRSSGFGKTRRWDEVAGRRVSCRGWFLVLMS